MGDGVSMMMWDDFIYINDLYTKVVYRKLIYDQKELIKPLIYEFIGENVGKKYQLTFGKLITRNSVIKK